MKLSEYKMRPPRAGNAASMAGLSDQESEGVGGVRNPTLKAKHHMTTKQFDGHAMYPTDISLLLDRLGAEFPEEMSALDTAIMDQCKTIMRENKAHWERFGIHEAAK